MKTHLSLLLVMLVTPAFGYYSDDDTPTVAPTYEPTMAPKVLEKTALRTSSSNDGTPTIESIASLAMDEIGLTEEEVQEMKRLLQPDTNGDPDFAPTIAPTFSPAPTTPSPPCSCFSQDSTVQELTRGSLAMKNVTIGDKILTKSGKYQPVFAFAHKQENVPGQFRQFYSKQLGEAPLEVTGEHLVYLYNQPNPIRADAIQVGDELDTANGPAKVTKIATIEREGLYVPLTLEGTVVVNGVASSSYISFHKDMKETILAGLSLHDYVHMTLSPFRMICFGISSSFCEWHDEQTGMPQYISLGVKLNDWIFQQSSIIQALALFGVVFLTGTCWAVESIFGPAWGPRVIAAMLMAGYAYSTKRNSPPKVKTV